MTEESRFNLAERLKGLRDTKQELEAEVKAVNGEIEEVQAELIADLLANESTGFNHKGFNYTLVVKEYPAAEPERNEGQTQWD
jgi:hypothetical protein